jgi:NAD(P)-dependent dehydrogenase (short-subunit alcohol dehydrogenase family)
LDVVDGADLTGKTCVITGASSGLGRESAMALAAAGARVVLATRNRDALAETRAWIHAANPAARIAIVQLDLTSLRGIRTAATAIRDVAPSIDVLMNNAGVMFTPFARTADGFEIQFGTNHLGHFELTRLLIPQLVAASGARVVILTSDGHRMSDLDFGDLNWERRTYDKFLAYGASKTANILHMVEVDRRFRDSGVRAYAVHPGIVATGLARHMRKDDFAHLTDLAAAQREPAATAVDVTRDFVMPDRGAATQVWAAVAPELDGVGSAYLADCGVRTDDAAYAVDEQRAARLWSLSEALCGDR